ncbi:MAG: single-strand selective monofunctional uracil DNA glycosylase, partial [Planctomycetota bacterium]
MSLPGIIRKVIPEFERMAFSGPVECVYNPLVYAWDLHRQYLERFGRGKKQVV